MIFDSIVVGFIKFFAFVKTVSLLSNLKKLSIINNLHNTALFEFISVFYLTKRYIYVINYTPRSFFCI